MHITPALPGCPAVLSPDTEPPAAPMQAASSVSREIERDNLAFHMDEDDDATVGHRTPVDMHPASQAMRLAEMDEVEEEFILIERTLTQQLQRISRGSQALGDLVQVLRNVPPEDDREAVDTTQLDREVRAAIQAMARLPDGGTAMRFRNNASANLSLSSQDDGPATAARRGSDRASSPATVVAPAVVHEVVRSTLVAVEQMQVAVPEIVERGWPMHSRRMARVALRDAASVLTASLAREAVRYAVRNGNLDGWSPVAAVLPYVSGLSLASLGVILDPRPQTGMWHRSSLARMALASMALGALLANACQPDGLRRLAPAACAGWAYTLSRDAIQAFLPLRDVHRMNTRGVAVQTLAYTFMQGLMAAIQWAVDETWPLPRESGYERDLMTPHIPAVIHPHPFVTQDQIGTDLLSTTVASVVDTTPIAHASNATVSASPAASGQHLSGRLVGLVVFSCVLNWLVETLDDLTRGHTFRMTDHSVGVSQEQRQYEREVRALRPRVPSREALATQFGVLHAGRSCMMLTLAGLVAFADTLYANNSELSQSWIPSSAATLILSLVTLMACYPTFICFADGPNDVRAAARRQDTPEPSPTTTVSEWWSSSSMPSSAPSDSAPADWHDFA